MKCLTVVAILGANYVDIGAQFDLIVGYSKIFGRFETKKTSQ